MTREATIIEGLPEPAEDMLSCGETQPTDDERARDVMVCCWLNRGHWGAALGCGRPSVVDGMKRAVAIGAGAVAVGVAWVAFFAVLPFAAQP